MSHPHIHTELPGPKARAMIERDAAVISPSYPRDYPFVMSHGRGTEVWDVDGNRFLDFMAGIAVCAVDYRLAPEARFPGAFDDVVAALQWVQVNGASVGIDAARLLELIAVDGLEASGTLSGMYCTNLSRSGSCFGPK